jgi:hypothetical protein
LTAFPTPLISLRMMMMIVKHSSLKLYL